MYSVKAHDQIINALDGIGGLGIGGGAPELVTGSRDGKLTIYIMWFIKLTSSLNSSLVHPQKS